MRRGWKEPATGFGLDEAIGAGSGENAAGSRTPADGETPAGKREFDRYLEEARLAAARLERSFDQSRIRVTDPELVPFLYVLPGGDAPGG